MKPKISTNAIFMLSLLGMFLTLSGVIIGFYFITKESIVLSIGIILITATLFWAVILIFLLRKRLSEFTDDLCQALDEMMSSSEMPSPFVYDETLFSRLYTRLKRLYEVMYQNQKRVNMERQELQSLVSDISHQVKTPVSNLKMLTDTLLEKPVSEEERLSFLQHMRSQLNKLDFLFGAMVKSSRLETGLVHLERINGRIYDTIAQALSGIIYSAEQKNITVDVNCSEALQICHDSKWTAEALFNILDNAVKYTPNNGSITVAVEEWEMHLKISIADTGKGIPEEQHAAIFRRFFRNESVHFVEGVGIGLYLSREIITRQGGYIKLTSELGQGSNFSVFLPQY